MLFLSFLGFRAPAQLVTTLVLDNPIPERLRLQAESHTNGSVHASSLFNNDNGELVAWFQQNLVLVQPGTVHIEFFPSIIQVPYVYWSH